MPVTITINGADAAESIKELSALAAGLTGQTVSATTVSTPEIKSSKTRTKQEAQKEEKVAPPEPQDDPSAENQGITDDEPIPTDVELREVARNVGAKGPEAKAAIKELLTKYGVSNITAVPENKRIAFKRELEAI